MSSPIWTPSPEQADSSLMARFANSVGRKSGAELHEWSVSAPEELWPAVGRFVGFPITDAEPVVDPGAWMGAASFFPKATLNVAQVILHGQGAGPDSLMWVALDESGRERFVTRLEATELVSRAAAAMRAEGVGAGDRVVACLHNGIEAQVTMLAAASIGAVFSSASPEFGIDAIVDRFGQLEPLVLVACASYQYKGKVVDCSERIRQLGDALPSLHKTVVVLRDPEDTQVRERQQSAHDLWDEWLDPHAAMSLDFEMLPFDHPWYVLFSSGTTGKPKGIVHRSGGVLLNHMKEHQLHCDMRPGDRVLYYTTTGWMMWNWLSSVPASGATAYLYDGSPFHPTYSTLFLIAAKQSLTFLGLGAKFIDTCSNRGLEPSGSCDLASLRTIASTGSPLSPASFEWIYAFVKDDVHLASISGGTDLCGCLVGGNPTQPVYSGEIQGPMLGMAISVWDDDRRPCPPGERGELVCTKPFPSQPLYFWGDSDDERYRESYFERFSATAGDEVWAQGDFATWSKTGGIVIVGRSDTTLNPGGVRIGTAEIYRQAESIQEVDECLVFGQEVRGDTRIVMLVRMSQGQELDDHVAWKIRAQIRVGCSPRHIPSVIAAVSDLPRTWSGKLSELAAVDVVAGRPVRNHAALANPEVLVEIATLPELRLSQNN